MATVPMVRVRSIAKHYAVGASQVSAVRDVSLTIQAGEFYTLLGPSGSGKTTVLRCIAGLEHVDAGSIEIAGSVVASRTVAKSAYERDLGMVFQSYAIWPHMSVFENVAFPLRMAGVNRLSELRVRVGEALARVGLGGMEDRPAPQLSGGQQQRVALARALVRRPKVLLLDEPLSNLDAELRAQMRLELRRLTRDLGITTIYVTHDQIEALMMSDRIGIMHRGVIEQEGTSADIYQRPRSTFAARFIGAANMLTGRVASRSPDGSRVVVATSIGPIESVPATSIEVGDDVDVVIRPEVIQLIGSAHGEAINGVAGRVRDVVFAGAHKYCEIEINGTTLVAHLHPFENVTLGQHVDIGFHPSWITVVPRSAET